MPTSILFIRRTNTPDLRRSQIRSTEIRFRFLRWRGRAALVVSVVYCILLPREFPGGITKTDWQRPSVIALVLANLVPVFGVFYFHWEVFPLMFLFWSENVIIGVFNVLRMIFAMPFKNGMPPLIPFFCVHYGMFTFGHGMVIIGLFGGGLKDMAESPDLEFLANHERQSPRLDGAGAGRQPGDFLCDQLRRPGRFWRIEPSHTHDSAVWPHLRVAYLPAGRRNFDAGDALTGRRITVLVALKILLDLAGNLREGESLRGPPAAL